MQNDKLYLHKLNKCINCILTICITGFIINCKKLTRQAVCVEAVSMPQILIKFWLLSLQNNGRWIRVLETWLEELAWLALRLAKSFASGAFYAQWQFFSAGFHFWAPRFSRKTCSLLKPLLTPLCSKDSVAHWWVHTILVWGTWIRVPSRLYFVLHITFRFAFIYRSTSINCYFSWLDD